MFKTEQTASSIARPPLPVSEIDHAITIQIAVAWAGEAGDPKRLGWWRSDFVSEFGGEDLFRRLLPSTWEWAVLEAAREAAFRKEAELRRMDSEPDHVVSLYHLGFVHDERIGERLADLKRASRKPYEALPGLAAVVERTWNPERFIEWGAAHGTVDTTTMPIGRRIKGAPPASLGQLVSHLLCALVPLADKYPLPHFRRSV